MDIFLKEDTELLDEVVIVGYGAQKKATLSGSVTSVGGEAKCRKVPQDAGRIMCVCSNLTRVYDIP